MSKYISKLDDIMKALGDASDDILYEVEYEIPEGSDSTQLQEYAEEFRRLMIDFKDEFENCKKLLKGQDKII